MPVNATFHHDTLMPATKPTIYFIGVTTAESSIRRVFPRWAERLCLGDTELAGVDLPLHADPEHYRRVVEFIRADPLSIGALVTTHKIDLFRAASDLFDTLGPMAALMGEISCLSKRDGAFTAEAKDPISCGLAADQIAPPGYWRETRADALVLGAGGSAIAISWYLARTSRGGDRPRRIIVSNRSRPRLERLRQIHASVGTDIPVEYVHSPEPHINDAVLTSVAPGSLVVNATGLGKDTPGSPLTDAAVFPPDAIAWDLNYRGDLVFMEQARAAGARGVRAVDGWEYFLHGWTQVISEVYHVEIPTRGADFDALSALAAEAR
jgi:shikimate 5-dehydrogenase